MKILILTWRDLAHEAAGGAEVYTEQVAANWARWGIDVTLFAAAVPGRPAEELVDGYRVVRAGGRFTVYRQARRWWERQGRFEGFDLVIDMINTVPFTAHRWITDVPTVAFAHQTCEDIWKYNAPRGTATLGRRVLEPRWLRAYRDIPTMAVSASTRDALRDFGITDVTVVPEGIEPPALVELPTKEQRPTIVWCARHVPYKRPLDLIDAASRLQASIPDLQVWMIGGGPLLEQVRAAAPAGIEVLGRVSEEEKLDRMARAHVHVATSLREGWGLVVSEAAALGTPTVAYDVPGLRDSTLAAGGVVVPPTPDALVAWLPSALETWIADPIEPIPYGGAHSWEFVAQQVLHVALTKSDLARTFGPPLTVVRDAA